jgi:hypothetical protein
MANAHHLFQHYNRAIKLTDEKRVTLISFRDSLRKRMDANFKKIPLQDRRNLEMYFQTQGSFIMDTIIKPVNDDFDLDDGVYFQGTQSRDERPEPQVFHDWVYNAINHDNDYEKVTDKQTCVRVKYKLGFHIDIPIYYADNFESPDLAEKVKWWMLSNPVEFIGWFEEKTKSGFQKAFIYNSLKYAEPYEKWLTDIRKADCQLRRLVRYMKAWADLKKAEMPCGIIMTILVAENFAVDDRDDVAFYNTLISVRNYLQRNGFQCPRPTSPQGEDLFASSSQTTKEYFMNALNGLIRDADKALNADNEKDACKEWEKHFGSRFPCHLAKGNPIPVVKREPNIESLKRVAAVQQPWNPKS